MRVEEAEALSYAVSECSPGWVLVAGGERGIRAILLGDDPARLVANLEARFPAAVAVATSAEDIEGMPEVVQAIEEPERVAELTLTLDIRGTAFQQRVWEAVREIGPGETESYAEVADRIGMPLAARAVGNACGRNAHAMVIPCHRVIASDGGLGGYGWGLDMKRRLLEREQR